MGNADFPGLVCPIEETTTASTAHNSVPNTALNLLGMRSRAMAVEFLAAFSRRFLVVVEQFQIFKECNEDNDERTCYSQKEHHEETFGRK